MITRFRGIFKSERANAAVELALVLPFLLAMLMGIIEFGRVLFFQQVITNAARESSRASATGFEPYADAANRVLNPAGVPTPSTTCSSPSSGDANICLSILQVGNPSTNAHQVVITYNMEYVTPLGPVLDLLVDGSSGFGSGITMAATAVMRE